MPRKTNQTVRRALSRAELRALANKEAKKLIGRSADEAFEMLDRGELRDSAAAEELRMLRHLLKPA